MTHSKLSSPLSNMGIKTVAWFYIHSPIFYYEFVLTYNFILFSINVDVSLVRISHCTYIL